jgi:hypothetical protein
MPRRLTWAFVVHAVPTVGLLLQGLLYLTTPTFMPYHADALAVTWEELPAHHQGFLLGVIKAMGAGSVGVSFALLLILFSPFRSGSAWAGRAVPAIGIVFTVLVAYAAYTIDVLTPAETPWRQTCALTGLYFIGGIISSWRRAS